MNEGQNNEYVVTREQAAQWLGYAEDVLTDYFPRKEDEINKVRPASTEAARKILPTMLERGSEDHHAAQLVWKNYPMLAGHPERDYLTAIFLRGFKLTAQEIAAKAKGNGDSKLRVPAKILQAHADKDRRPPLQRQTPPGRSSVTPTSKANGMEKAMERMKQSGGSRESLIAGLTALEQNDRPRSRDPVPI
ncbi:MAG: hypothetical protein H0U23_08065 [Blastocatellia bacterium]|nr:hypothetical protein [Blastocatellia bacterium]